MTFLFIAFALAIGGTFLALKLTNNLHKKFYRMADERGCADNYEFIVRQNNYTQPRDLESAYQEALSYTKAP